jgi:membrane protein insertase Oxa1/YidC/SpoIIIJ
MTSMASSPIVVDHLQRIRRISRVMVWACVAMVITLPIALVYYWAITNAPELGVQHGNLRTNAMLAPLETWQRVAAAAVTAVPLLLLLIGVWQAKRCFAQFAAGEIFTTQATGHLRRFAGWVAAAALAAIVASAATSALLTLQNPPGMRLVVLGISSTHLFSFFFAALVWLMADVIGQAQTLAEENAHFV